MVPENESLLGAPYLNHAIMKLIGPQAQSESPTQKTSLLGGRTHQA